jgi:hypothetical protein
MLCSIAGTTTLDENVFVDDTSIGEKSNEMNSLCNMINTDLKKNESWKNISEWSKQCLVKLNPTKTDIVYLILETYLLVCSSG